MSLAEYHRAIRMTAFGGLLPKGNDCKRPLCSTPRTLNSEANRIPTGRARGSITMFEKTGGTMRVRFSSPPKENNPPAARARKKTVLPQQEEEEDDRQYEEAGNSLWPGIG